MIGLVVALPAEARPIASRLGLQSLGGDQPPVIWEGKMVTLVVSGVGKIAAAAAVAHLRQRLTGSPLDGWINVGIGGHRTYPLGTPVLASQVRDGASGECWSPAIPFKSPCRTDTVLTVERVERAYTEPAVYDMEASGFYEAAMDPGRPGLVQVLKVVSDNRKSGVDTVSSSGVERLLEASGDTIENLISAVAHWAQGTATGG